VRASAVTAAGAAVYAVLMMVFLLYAVTALLAVILITREVVASASKAHCDKRWQIYAMSINTVSVSAALLVGYFFERQVQGYALLPLGHTFPSIINGLMTFLIASFIAYWWHRLTHHNDWLWRKVHQLHHAPPRIETLTAFYAHPLDTFSAATITCSVAYLLLGVSVESAAWGLLFASFFNLYEHSDTSSPDWLGYLT
jgi:sterol desaturase/sphingolipid hydroxylase (fatty acid hydroxylase superfamily)